MSRSKPAISRANTGALDVRSGVELVELMEAHATPVSSLVWADSQGSIGYKTVGRVPIRSGASPDLPRCGWSGEDEWEGWIPYDEMPELTDPDSGYVVTANNRIEPGASITTSERLLRRLPGDPYRADAGGRARARPRASPACRRTCARCRLETAHRLSRLEGRDQAEIRAIERLRSWDGLMDRDSVAASIYQAFTLRFARELARAVIGDRDLSERWLDRAHNGFMAHVLAVALAGAHAGPLGGGRREADRQELGRVALDSLRGALADLEHRFGDDRGMALGQGPTAPLCARGADHCSANPQPLRSGRGRPGDGLPGRLGPERPLQEGDLGAVLAHGRRHVRAEGSRWQQFTGNSGHPGSPNYDDLQARWRDGRTQASAGEGPWCTLRLEPGARGS